MARLATIALERGAGGRIDFHVLDWNPARGFYQKLGFEHHEEWLRYVAPPKGGSSAPRRVG